MQVHQDMLHPYDLSVKLDWPDIKSLRSSSEAFLCERVIFFDAKLWIRVINYYEGINGFHQDLKNPECVEHAIAFDNSDVEVRIPKAVLDCGLIRAINVPYKEFIPGEYTSYFFEKYKSARIRIEFP